MIPFTQGKVRPASKQLSLALKILQANDFRFGNLKMESEFYDLELITPEERSNALLQALSEIKPSDRHGPHPPGHKSTDRKSKGARLYAFVWQSLQFGRRMYLKFCIDGPRGHEELVVFSFHDDNPRKVRR